MSIQEEIEIVRPDILMSIPETPSKQVVMPRDSRSPQLSLDRSKILEGRYRLDDSMPEGIWGSQHPDALYSTEFHSGS